MAEAAPGATGKGGSGQGSIRWDLPAVDGGHGPGAADKSNRPGLLQRFSTSVRSVLPGWSTKTHSPSPEHSRENSPERESGDSIAFPRGADPTDEDPTSREESNQEEIVAAGGVGPGNQRTTFESEQHGFRLHIQQGSVPENQTLGPITVTPLKESFKLYGGNMEAVLEIHCQPAKCRFDPPLLFDLRVEGGNKDDPIIDQYGRIRYEVVTRDCSSNDWIRDPEDSTPLEIVQDDHGNIYVRAQIRHFCFWRFLKKLDFGDQCIETVRIPWTQQRRHQSIVKNETAGNVDIQVYAMRVSQWDAVVESATAGVGVEGVGVNIELSGRLSKQVHAAAMLPQMATIKPKKSHWFEIPRVGTGLLNSRKAVMFIVTTEPNSGDGKKRMRLEATIHVRCKTMVTVKLPVATNGDPPIASEEGGTLDLLMRVIRNYANATPRSSPQQANNTEAGSSRNVKAGSPLSACPAFGGEPTGRLSDGALEAFSLTTGPDTNGVVSGDAHDRPAATSLGRDPSTASSLAPPAELQALSRVG
eukprot:g2250.t1